MGDPSTEDDDRARVIAIAQTWLNTPYHHEAEVRGHGVDCAKLLKCVFEEAGVIAPIAIPNYSPQWYLHRDAELYMDRVLEHAQEIPEIEAKPADVVLWRIGRTYSHGAIIMPPGWPHIIHAHGESGRVVLARGTDGRLGDPKRLRRFFKARW